MLSGLLAAVILAACGGTARSGTGTTTSTSATSGGTNAKADIRQTWAEFFNAGTPTAKRVSLLQDGQRYKPAIVAESKSPLAGQSKARVLGVTLTSPSKAQVRYTILIAGQPALKNQTGTAVKASGGWKVSDASFCRLLGLQGTPPRPCTDG